MSDTLVNIIELKDLLAYPEPEWLVQDHFHEQEVVVLYGQPNMGKSFVALDWALSIAAGIPWVGRYAVKQAPVLYMAGEGAPSLQKRVEAWLAFKGLRSVPIYFQCRPLPLREDETIEDIQSALHEFKEDHETGPTDLAPGLVVVDTLSQFMFGGDENGPDMALMVANLRRLSQEEGLAILLVHHTNKGGKQERGHTALRGNSDVMFSIDGENDENGQLKSVTLLNDKMRDNPKAEPVRLVSSLSHKSLVFSLGKKEFVSHCLTIVSDKSLMNLLKVAENIEDDETESLTSKSWFEGTTLSRPVFYRLQGKLLSNKVIKPAGRGKYALTHLGRNSLSQYALRDKK